MNVLIGCVTFFNLLYLINCQDVFYEGFEEFDKCQTTSGSDGTCRFPNNCPALVKGRILGVKPKICGFTSVSFALLICCPAQSEKVSVVSAPKVSFDCGYKGIVKTNGLGARFIRKKRAQFKPAVVGGQHSIRNAWPWMALLGNGNVSSGITSPNFFCDGVLINERFILTAAHCLLESDDFFLRLEEHNYKDPNDGAHPKDLSAESVTIHPKYDINVGYNDLAIVKLSRKMNITDTLRPICLPWDAQSHLDLINTEVMVTGWGAEYYGGPPSPILQEVTVKIFNSSVCEKSYSTLSDYKQLFPQGINSENILCAGDIEGGKDACQGDSGAPLFSKKTNSTQYYLAGIVSKGYGCGLKEFPGLYAPLRNQLNLQWIKDVAFSKD